MYRSEFRTLKNTLSVNVERTLMKHIVDQQSQRVLDIHMVGADAGEVIKGFAMAVKMGVTKQ